MKIKSSTLVVILIVSMTPIFFSAFAVTTPLFGVGDVREELYAPFDANVLTANGLPEVDPFWVDLVDAEVVSNDGEGVYIAVLDTGLVEDWPFFFSQADIAWDLGKGFSHDVSWDGNDYVFGPLLDDRGFSTHWYGSGHGTHVTSTIVGFNVNNAFWVRGVAPKASIIPVLVLDTWIVPGAPNEDNFPTFGTDEMVAAGIQYIADLAPTLDGPVIISMSLGDTVSVDIIENAINNAIEAGVIIIASAGNEGYAGMGWPGAYPQVISVAAGGWTGQWPYGEGGFWLSDVPEDLKTPDYLGNNWQLYLEDFSSRPNKYLGQKSFHLDVCAPGSSIVGPFQSAVYWNPDIGSYVQTPLNYYYLWGTSMAAPHVSGMASLVLEEYPDVEQAKMEKILKNAARGLPLPADGSWVWDPWYGLYHFEWSGNEYGAGWLQADAALISAAKFA